MVPVLNILTDKYNYEPSAEIANSFGSYNTHKHTVKFSTGLFNDHWEFAGRASVIKSDGYIDRASTDLKSYFFQGSYVGETTLIKALTFGGSEVTYQAWDGIDEDQLKEDRRFNPAGAYEDEKEISFYDNHVMIISRITFNCFGMNVMVMAGLQILPCITPMEGAFMNLTAAVDDLQDYGLEPFDCQRRR